MGSCLQASLATVVNETQMNQSVVLTVVRDGGTFGDINIDWTVTGGHNVAGNIDILPTSGTVSGLVIVCLKYSVSSCSGMWETCLELKYFLVFMYLCQILF